MTNIKSTLKDILQANTTPDVFTWIEEGRPLNSVFMLLPRKTGKAALSITQEQSEAINTAIPGFSVDNWTVDHLGRAYLLAKLDSTHKDEYFRKIESLFMAAEMAEQVALYSSLPLLAHPELWVKRCAEGIRSNIGIVLEAIMYSNPYPSQNLEQAAWNQLVLKAFFTDKDINKIVGIDKLANKDLAYIISDYAHERWAAGRELNPQMWRLVGPFIDDKLFEDIKRLFDNGKLTDHRAGALAITTSNYAPAKALLNKYPELERAIANNELSWDDIAG
ncbi:EboA domain-containing protein [Mucilaginibacter ximonensis]|uniref:EboA domain-containing protein n=1 Tax=Mucilaginibacter ximonensis TaxID=538021 RepID=A0ABW5YBA8_9SPHI